MSEHVYKTIELTGSSKVSSDEAVRNAVAKANESIDYMGWFKVTETRGHIVEGVVEHWQVTIKVGFRLDSDGS